jgi:hypothetical protein
MASPSSAERPVPRPDLKPVPKPVVAARAASMPVRPNGVGDNRKVS